MYPEGVMLEDVSCPNSCIDNGQLVLEGCDRLHNIPGEFKIIRCGHCGLERTSPRPTADTIGVYYPSDYGPYQSGSSKNIVTKPIGIKGWILDKVGLESRRLPSIAPGDMLEVGCSSGNYMEQVKRIGWHVEGIEFSDEAASIARSKGFKVLTSSIESAEPPSSCYDVITAWMVIEHLHEPVEALTKMKQWVKPEGYLVMAVPDRESVSRYLFKNLAYDLHLPNHLFHFSKKSLTQTLESAGWEVEKFIWQRNCNTILRSLEYWCEKRKHLKMLKAVEWVRLSDKAGKFRLLMNILAGFTRQSGRMEVWARPVINIENKK